MKLTKWIITLILICPFITSGQSINRQRSQPASNGNPDNPSNPSLEPYDARIPKDPANPLLKKKKRGSSHVDPSELKK